MEARYPCEVAEDFTVDSSVEDVEMLQVQATSYHMVDVEEGYLGEKLDASAYKCLLGIVNDCHHWFLVRESPAKKKKCLETPRAPMRKLGVNVSRWKCDTVAHPLQEDTTSCRVFALKGQAHYNSRHSNIDDPRREIVTTIMTGSDDLSDLCHFCGEEDTFDKTENVTWIACDACLRWFHTGCVGNPAMESNYACCACLHACVH
ncbi:unnamed protein product [Boreogadus saida]